MVVTRLANGLPSANAQASFGETTIDGAGSETATSGADAVAGGNVVNAGNEASPDI